MTCTVVHCWWDRKGENPLCYLYMGVSKNNGTPKSSILIRFSIINHPFWDTPIFGNTHIHLFTTVLGQRCNNLRPNSGVEAGTEVVDAHCIPFL